MKKWKQPNPAGRVLRLEPSSDDRQCGDKRKYNSRQYALKVMRQMRQATNNDPDHPLNVYKCVRCGLYHIGHNRRVSA